MSKLTNQATSRKEALKEFLIGLAVAAAGGLMTGISYNSARPGGTYTVFTGLIALGAIYGLHGLWRLIFPSGIKGALGKQKSQSVEANSVKETAAKAEEAEVVDEN